MTAKSGKQPEKKPQRGERLKIELTFDEALRAAVETKPPNNKPAKKRKGK